MWYLKVSSSLLIAVALICMIQNAISLAIDPQAPDDKWSTLTSSTDQNDLKKISKLCKVSLNNFKDKLENTKTIANKKLTEPNKTTEDITNLVSEIKTQVKNASADLVNVRKLVQKTALRFRDTFKSLVSFTELDSESVNKELESIKKTAVDNKKPLVNRVIRSFGNRYDLNKLANKVLEITSDREKLKNNYDEKKKIAKKEFNSLWNSLSNHSKTVNDNALKALDTFFEGMKSVKSVKKKVKTLGDDALDEIKLGDDIIKLKNAVELAKALKLKFEDEWNLDSGELTYSEEQKKPNTKVADENQSDVPENEQDKNDNEDISMNDIQPKPEQETNGNDKANVIPPTEDGIKKLNMDNIQTSDKTVPPFEETQLTPEQYKDEDKKMQPTISETENSSIDNNVSNTLNSPIEENTLIPNTENKDTTAFVQPEVSNKKQNSIYDNALKLDSSTQEKTFNPDINNNKAIPRQKSIDNTRLKKIKNKRTSREKTLILPWAKLIQLDNPQISQQSIKCENLLNNVTPAFDNIKKAAKNSILVTKNYKNLQRIENDTVKQFYDKMVDTNTKLCDYLVNAAEDVCTNVTPINKRYETKFKNDPNIKRIKYLLGKQYDPNQYILKILDDANHKNGIGGTKKKTYYKMLAVSHNLNHETKEMENAALYAMNKIHEGKLAATNLQKMFNKEKASKACYIRNILLEEENENDKKNKDENKEKVKESINEDINTEPLKQTVDLDSVDEIQPLTVSDDHDQIISNNKETNPYYSNSNHQNNDEKLKLSEEYETNKEEEDTNLNKSGETNTDENKDSDLADKADAEHSTEIPEKSESEMLDSKEGNDNHDGNDLENKSVKPKVKRRRKIIDPANGNEISEEFETSEEDDGNLKNSIEMKPDENKDSDLPDKADTEHSTEIPEKSESEMLDSKERNDNHDGNDLENKSVKPKVKRRRKIIDPANGNEISEEFETSEEDDGILNNSVEIKPDENKDSELPDKADAKHSTEIPDKSESEMLDSKEGNDNHDANDLENKSVKPKVKRRRKIIDPANGNEISEEFETSEEDDGNLNNSVEMKPDENKDSDLLDTADAENSTEIPEKTESEMLDSKEGNDNHDGNDLENKSVKPKVKRRGKIIDPAIGNEISEEFETSEEGDGNLNRSIDENSDILKQDNESYKRSQGLKTPQTIDKEADSENITKESVDLEENENLNSVDDEELNCVNNDNIIPAAESMGEDSSSQESMYDEPEIGLFNKPGNFKRRNRKPKDPEYDQEESEEYETIENDDNDEINKLKNKNTDFNNNILPHKENNLTNGDDNSNYQVDDQDVNSEPSPYDGYNVKDTTPETEDVEHRDIEQPKSSENGIEAPEASTSYDNDGNINDATPRPRKIRLRRKSRKPESDNENDNEPEIENDDNNSNYPVDDQEVYSEPSPYDGYNVQDTTPETENVEPRDIEQPESSENGIEAPEASTSYDNDGSINDATPRPRKIRRRRKSRKPESDNENDNEPEIENDDNNSNYPVDDQDVNSEPRPYDGYNVQDTTPETENVEPRDIEQPESSENGIEEPEASTPYNNDGGINDATPQPRKSRRRRRSRKPESDNDNDTEPEVGNDDNNSNYPVDDQEVYSEPSPYDGYNVQDTNPETENVEPRDIEQPESSENGIEEPEASTPYNNDGGINDATPQPRKSRRRRRSRKPESDNDNETEPEVGNDDNNSNYPVDDQEVYSESSPYDGYNVQDTTPETEDVEPRAIEQPQSSENGIEAPEASTPYDNDGGINDATPRPRKSRRRRRSRKPESDNENDNEPDVENDDNNSNYPVDDQDVNSEPRPYDGYNVQDTTPETENVEPRDIEQPESSENGIEAPEASTPYDNDGGINDATPRPRKSRRRRRSRKPESDNDNETEPEVGNDDNNSNYPVDDQEVYSEPSPYDGYNVQDTTPETENVEPRDIEQPESSENGIEAPEASTSYDNDGSINDATPRPRKIRRRRKSRKPESDNENDNEPEIENDDNNSNYPVDDQDVNSEPRPYDGYNVQDTTPETENVEPRDIEQPESSENGIEEPEASTPYNNDGGINDATPQPRKSRRRRRSRKPESDNDNDTEPEVGNDDNNSNYPVDDQEVYSEPSPYDGYNVQDTNPETENVEPRDIEQPESSENGIEEPEASTPYNNDGGINDATPQPRKSRRRRRSRKPESDNDNDTEPEVGNDDNNSNYPVDDQEVYSEPSPYDGYNVQDTTPETEDVENRDIEQPESSENGIEEPESSTPYNNDGGINDATPQPRKSRRRRRSRKPESDNDNDKKPEVGNDDNNSNYPVDDQEVYSESSPYDGYNVQDTTPETEDVEPRDIEQPQSSENGIEAPEASTPYDNDGGINDATPRPRKSRRRRRSRKPESDNENDNEPDVENDDNNSNYPVDDQDVNSEPRPYDGYNVQDTTPETENVEPRDIEQPESSENGIEAPEASTPYDNDGGINDATPRPRKSRRRRRSRKPESVNENDNEPEVGNDDNNSNYPVDDQDVNSEPSPYDGYNVQDTNPETENVEPRDIEQPESSENGIEAPEASTPYDNDGSIHDATPRPRKSRRRRRSRKPESVHENDNEPEVGIDDNNSNYPVDDQGVNSESSPYDGYNVQDTTPETENVEPRDIEQPESSENGNEAPEASTPYDNEINDATPRPHKIRRRRRSRKPESVSENDNSNQNNHDTEKSLVQNDRKSGEILVKKPKVTRRNPKRKRHVRRIRTYMVNRETNERIPINDQTYTTTDGLPDTIKNELDANEIENSYDPDTNADIDDYSSFLFKEYNSDQCKRDAYDRFKKVTSQDAKQIAYRSVLDTSEMRSNMLATIKSAISNVKVSKTFNDVDQSLRTVSSSLKYSLKQTVGDLVTKVIPLAKDFLITVENLKELYKNGPQSTHKMLSNILENESTVPDSAKDVLKLISPQFNVDELINNIFDKPFSTNSLKEKKAKAQRKLIGLSKHMDTAISNIDCFVLSAMSAVGIGADTLKLLKSGRVIMSDKHPRAKALRDALGIIKSGKKIRNNDVNFAPTLTSDGTINSDEDDDDEDPDEVAQKNEEFLKTVPDIDDNMTVPKKVKNKRRSLGVIVVHPDKQIEYKEVHDTSQLKKFVGEQTKKYKLESQNKPPKFLKLNSKKLIENMVQDVKKKAEINGMSKKEMVEEIINNLKNN